ncbi:putative GNAT superfamily acetyltransferase [Actinocrispum wychmicini]|uniref:Putative GNAT superfamily acetyltransferase n=2 Tax=Actinocrispum wychmicini TaxID=1213861 RepID=A0A4R2JU01_9PSEU|nr:putative GNAT superfamily acetyltransferase [Actinocrispum wychmicini]
MTLSDSISTHDASKVAAVAAATSGVDIRELHDMTELQAVDDLFRDIWRPDPANPPITCEFMRVLSHSGNYVVGAYAGGKLVGATVGILAAPIGRTLHSHVTGVHDGMRGRSVGYALKLHQRAWALARGLDSITWTFDPLVRRNAYFNLAKLAARPVRYLPDFYGEMNDGINGDGPSDRLLVRWDLAGPEVVAACAGRPPETAPRGVLVAVPADIETLRTSDPTAADQWRQRLRQALGDRMDAGAVVVGFTREGAYVIRE